MAYTNPGPIVTFTGTVTGVVCVTDDTVRGTYADATFLPSGGTAITINVPFHTMMVIIAHAKEAGQSVTVDYGTDSGPNGPYRLLSVTW